MRRWGLAALCAVVLLGASVAIPVFAERPTLLAMVQSALTRMAPPEGRPQPSPIPRNKAAAEIADAEAEAETEPEKQGETETADMPDEPADNEPSPAKPAYETVAQCGSATIVAKPALEGEPRIYLARFAEDMVENFADQGCGLVQRGCNTCSVRYTGCSEEAKAACDDVACLSEKCERQVICSSKYCTVEGAAPSCDSRLVQAKCLRPVAGTRGVAASNR